MDLFCEQIVKKHSNTIDKITLIIMAFSTFVIGVIVLLVVSIYTAPIIGIALCIIIFYLGFFLISNTKCEYEYIITNGDIDVDKIINGRKRKRLASTNIKSFTSYGKLEENTPKFNSTIINASDNIFEHTYYAEFKHDKKGNIRLLFSPNEKTLKHIKPFVSRTINQH